MRLVDADYIKESVKRQCDNCRKEGMKWMADSVERAIIEELDNTPTARTERKKGMWIKLDMHAHIADHKCTACGQECYVPTCMGEPMYTYCPNCGARMDGGVSE